MTDAADRLYERDPLTDTGGMDQARPCCGDRARPVASRCSRHIRRWTWPGKWGVTVATILVFHEVDDVEHWLRSPKREEIFGPMGITGRLFTDPAKTNRVGLIVEVPDMQAFQQVMQSGEAAETMRFDGVRPDTLVMLDEASGQL